MKLGTHVHYTKTSKCSYSAKSDYALGGCGGNFPKWPLGPISETKRRRTFNFYSIYIGFVRRRFQKKYWQMYHTILSDIVNVILQNDGHFQRITNDRIATQIYLTPEIPIGSPVMNRTTSEPAGVLRQHSQYDSRLGFSSRVLVKVRVRVRLGLG